MNKQNQLVPWIQRILAFSALLAFSITALAHTGLKASNPADGAIINAAPGNFT